MEGDTETVLLQCRYCYHTWRGIVASRYIEQCKHIEVAAKGAFVSCVHCRGYAALPVEMFDRLFEWELGQFEEGKFEEQHAIEERAIKACREYYLHRESRGLETPAEVKDYCSLDDNEPGVEPTEYEQEEYFRLSYAQAHACQALSSADAAMEIFMSQHVGKSFKVFRPEHIDAAFAAEPEPSSAKGLDWWNN